MNEHKYQDIPAELKALPNWVMHKNKAPKNPINGKGAMANKASTWTTFDVAIDALDSGEYDGLGFQFGESGDNLSGYFGVDLDDVIDGNGTLDEKARQIVQTLNSYTEISLSGHGLHIICKGSLPACGKSKMGTTPIVEMYDRTHYFTVTGKPYGSARPIADRTSEGVIIYETYIKRPAQVIADKQPPRKQTDISDRDLLSTMFHSANGVDIERLYRGDWKSGYKSQSEADLALCNHLAWYTNNDAARIDNMFRDSGLMRPKWDEKHGAETYGAKTIQQAIAGTNGGYDPNSNRQTAAPARPVDENEYTEADQPPLYPSARALEPVSLYLCSDFKKDMTDYAKYKDRRTGFSNLDEVHGSLYSGLYVLGATSSLGKTTMMLQLCDQLAAAGEYCIYFTLEQSRLELVTKSISRFTARDNEERGISARSIKNGYMNNTIQQALQDYQQIADHITVIDGAFNITIDVIRDTVKQAIADFGRKPVVFVDYLQIIQPTAAARLTGRDKIDDVTRELKRLQAQEGLLMFVVSSFNRANYMTPVDFESYKESGGIEYTADVLWGIQLQAIHDPVFDKDKDIKAKREAIRQAREESPRHVELVCLKNRYGGTYSCDFTYNQRFDLFTEGGYSRPTDKDTGIQQL